MIKSSPSSYDTLIWIMNQLLLDNWDALKDNKIEPVPQSGNSMKHTMKELNALTEKYPIVWKDTIGTWKKKFNLQ